MEIKQVQLINTISNMDDHYGRDECREFLRLRFGKTPALNVGMAALEGYCSRMLNGNPIGARAIHAATHEWLKDTFDSSSLCATLAEDRASALQVASILALDDNRPDSDYARDYLADSFGLHDETGSTQIRFTDNLQGVIAMAHGWIDEANRSDLKGNEINKRLKAANLPFQLV